MSSKNTNTQTTNSGAKDLSFGGQKRILGGTEELKTENDKGSTFKNVIKKELGIIMLSQHYDRAQKAEERRQAEGEGY